MPTALINGARINYVQIESLEPDAEDLIMVHGLATSLAFWYLPYASVFAQRYRVTVFDLRGHGRSEMTHGGYTPQAQAADLEGLMDHLGIENAHFVAHSFGGVVALCVARRAPDRVTSMVLADTQMSATRQVPADAWPHARLIQRLLDRHGLDIDACSPYFGYQLLTKVAELLVGGDPLPGDLLELVGPTLGRHPRRTAKRWLDLVDQAEDELSTCDGLTAEVLHSFSFPLLAMFGDRSKACATKDILRAVWPHADFVTIRDAGHFFPSSRASEVIAACEQFWDERVSLPSKVAV
jgi:pimeloyl-ACP methyl ester carboxylesterase